MNKLQVTTDKSLTRPLKILVPLIKDELEAGDKAGIEHYRVAGEMLVEAKEQVTRGEWRPWIDRNFHLSQSTAERYMALADMSKSARAKISTLSDVREPGRDPSHRPQWHSPVREIASRVNVEALAQDRQNRENEKHLLHQLSHQLIDIGYKVLAAKLHPDKSGGSHDAMKRLNEVRRILKEAI